MVKLALPEKIVTDRLLLQRLRYEDAEEIFYTYASKLEATRFLSWATHQSINDTRAFLAYACNAWKSGKDYSYTVRLKDNHRLIGSFGIINDQGKLQFGYVFSPTQWGRGYATEVCTAMMAVLKTQPGVYRIHTFVDAANVASVKVLLRSGLIEEARLEKWFRFINQEDTPRDCILFYFPMGSGRW